MSRCPHGDPFCPCQDEGDSCHYEGPDPMPCPNPPTYEERFSEARLMRIAPDGTIEDQGVEIREMVLRSSYPTEPHCHVEGCRWRGPLVFVGRGCDPVDPGCGLLRIAPETSVAAAHELGCGAIRAEVARGQAWLRDQPSG